MSFALRDQGQVGRRLLDRLIDTFIGDVSVLAFDRVAGDCFGGIAASLASARTPIGGFDTLIAAHALAADLILIMNNTKHFARVDGLRTDDWS